MIENLIIAYTLNDSGFLGYLPECVAILTDMDGEVASRFVKITPKNKRDFASQMDDVDELLLNLCLGLEKELILSKVNGKKLLKWDELHNTYFAQKNIEPANLLVKKFVSDYITKIQNRFFDRIGDRRLYIPQGKLPFMWKQLFVELAIPEVNYKFTYTPEGLLYSLTALVDNRQLDLKHAQLISLKPPRILKGNSIYEFDNQLNGSKLTPFFAKESIHIPLSKTEEYLHKFVTPLVAKNLVEAEGFTIQTITNLPLAVLKITESSSEKQLFIFDVHAPDDAPRHELLFELLFEYSEFHFRAGHSAPTIRMELTEDSLSFVKVERNLEAENQIASAFENWGLSINGRVKKMEYRKAIDWINAHYEKIEQLGVELRLENNDSKKRKLFVGTCSISMEIDEGNDWFDVKGKAIFGNFVVPIILVLRHIQQNKPEIRLPNGDYALIPQAWFDEYQLLSEVCIFEDDRLTVRKHHCVIANNLKGSGNNKLTLKDKLSKFLELEAKETYDLPLQFNGELRNYQFSGYQWLRLLDELDFGGCLADDMGLGKTIQTLCLLQWMKEQNRGTSLLIVPTSLVYNWQIETNKFCPEMKVHLYTGKNRSIDDTDFRNADLVIATYSVLRRDIDVLRSVPFHYLILDEAQAIKNPQSAVNQACLELKANRFLTLTGTPVENSLSDLWSQMHFTNRNMLGDVNRFMQGTKQPDKIEYYRQVINPFVLRRLKSAVLTDLPEKSIFVQYCDMVPAQLDAYRHIRNSYREQLLTNTDEHKGGNTFQLLEGLLRMRQCANHPVLADKDYTENSGKFEMVCHKLEEVIREGNKVLVFSSFVEHLKLYKNYLDEQQITYCYLDGSTKDRQHEVETFQNSSDHQVFLLSLKAGGTGLNLTRAGYVFLLDPWWNPAAEAQAFDRAHRIGQKNKVFVYKFISRNTIEEKIMKLQDEKLELFHSIIDAEQDISKQFNREELLGLLV